MTQPASQQDDLEGGKLGGITDDAGPGPHSTPADQSFQGESKFGDSSGPLFSMYSKAIEEEDSKAVETLQKDADGILIFSGLFTAAIAAFLAVTIQDLRPNSQDTSAFYLGNIYGVLADPNATRASTFAKPPPFSPPIYSIWVNSLWFLSFALSLICALLAMSIQLWVRRYISFTQPAPGRCSQEKRARIRATFFDNMNGSIPSGIIDSLPMLLHLSLFLFFGGLGIFLFHTNHTVFWFGSLLGFLYVFVCIGLMSSSPGTILILFGGIRFVRNRAEKWVSKSSWGYDLDILRWLIRNSDDDTLEKFFAAVPGFFNSKLVNHRGENFEYLLSMFWNTLNGFLCRTLSSNSVAESVKANRFDIGMKAMNVISRSRGSSPPDFLVKSWDQVPSIAEVEPAQLLKHCTSNCEHTAHYARCMVAKILASVPERDDRWIRFATSAFDLSEHDLRGYIDHSDDSLSLAITIRHFRRSIRSGFYDWNALKAFNKLDVLNTLPALQRDFCTLWNELADEAKKRGSRSVPAYLLRRIRHLYIPLHEGTASTDSFNFIRLHPSSYPLCDIASHRPDFAAHVAAPSFTSTQLDAPPTTLHHSTASTHAATSTHSPAQVPPSPLSVLNESLVPCDAGAASTSDPLLLASSIGSSITASPPPSLVSSFPNADDVFSLFSSSTPSRPTGNTTLPRLHARGLVNTGSMCFANAVLQLLVHSPRFRELGDLKGLRGAGGLDTSVGAAPLVNATVRFLEEFTFKEKEHHNASVVGSFEPIYIYDAMKEKRQLKNLLDGKHQNAEEFLNLYLEALNEELVELHRTHKPASEFEEEVQSAEIKVGKRDYTASPVESPMSRIFGGRSRLTVCSPSQSDTVTTEDWRLLQLNIQPDLVHAIQDALVHLSQPQPVQVGQYRSIGASQQVHIEVLPSVLILHLNRFLYDAAADGRVKINKPVNFTPELEIPSGIMASAAVKSAEPVHYKLYGVLYHHGESAISGHYTVDVLQPNGDIGGEAWLHIDDEAVSVVQHEEVFGGHNNEWGDARCAYMLFYCRTAPAWT